jgi:hypothetical protein
MSQRFLPAAIILGLAAFGLVRLPASEPAAVAITRDKDDVRFTVGGEVVGIYHTGKEWAKPFLWPLKAPGNIAVTRGWPMEKEKTGSDDHIHQKSVWFTHGDVIPEGIEIKHKEKGVDGINFWGETAGHGVTVCVGVDEPKVDKNHGRVTTRNEWQTADGVKVMDETRTLHFYELGQARLFVFDIDLHASVTAITFGDTKEGSFGIRIADALREKGGNGTLENADGKKKMANCWGEKSAWCDYWGTIDGKPVGVAIFDDPGNAVPACWHSRDYGLMAANPFGRKKSGFPAMKDKTDVVKLAKGEHLKFRYGLLVHTGSTADAKVADVYQLFLKFKE